jgi:hypothetical protein
MVVKVEVVDKNHPKGGSSSNSGSGMGGGMSDLMKHVEIKCPSLRSR